MSEWGKWSGNFNYIVLEQCEFYFRKMLKNLRRRVTSKSIKLNCSTIAHAKCCNIVQQKNYLKNTRNVEHNYISHFVAQLIDKDIFPFLTFCSFQLLRIKLIAFAKSHFLRNNILYGDRCSKLQYERTSVSERRIPFGVRGSDGQHARVLPPQYNLLLFLF